MAKIYFFIQTATSPAGIYVRLRDGRGIDAKAKTKFSIKPTDWSAIKGQPILRDASSKSLDGDLKTFHSDLLSHYNKTARTQIINSQWLKDFISPPEKFAELPTVLTAYFDYYITHKGNSIKTSSVTKLNVVKHLIEKFQKHLKRKFFIKDVDDNFKNEFSKYCINDGYAPNTIARTFRFIKTICYDAQSNGLEISPKLKKITLKNEKVEKIYLNLPELNLIEKAIFKEEALSNARDWLIISCETGQRVSDFLRFKREMIRYEKEKNGIAKPLIEFTQVKTGKIMTIPLSKKVIAILKKRKGDFPYKLSDQRYNEHIKTVCELAGLTSLTQGGLINEETKRKENGLYPKWKLVSSHIGRRSFCTNNYGKIPTSLLIGASGHATESQFLEYIGKSDSQKAMQLAEYF